MLGFYFRIAFKSLKRNPIITGLLVGAVGLGIGVSTTFITAHHIFSMDPIPHKSDRLFYVEMDNWDPNRGWNDDDPESLPNQVTYRDMIGLMESDIPTYQGGSFKASLYIYPDPDVGRPYKVISRMCFSDFFKLFEPGSSK